MWSTKPNNSWIRSWALNGNFVLPSNYKIDLKKMLILSCVGEVHPVMFVSSWRVTRVQSFALCKSQPLTGLCVGWCVFFNVLLLHLTLAENSEKVMRWGLRQVTLKKAKYIVVLDLKRAHLKASQQWPAVAIKVQKNGVFSSCSNLPQT